MWTTLGEIGIWQAGGTPSRSNKSYYNGNIPWLKTGDLNDGFITDIPESITEEALANSSAKLNPIGSILIAMYGATIGKLGILTCPATTNQACCACIQYKAVIQSYLFYFLLSQRSRFIAKGGGGAQPNISKEIIVATNIPLPPLAEQSRIVNEIEYWIALINQIEQGKTDIQNTIKQVKSKILDLAISGKLVPQNEDDEPAIELLKRINPKFKHSDNSHYENLPKGWELISYKNAVKNISSKKYQILQSDIKTSGIYPVVSQSANYIEGFSDCIEKVFNSDESIIFGDHTRNVKFINFPFVVGADGVKILQTKLYSKYVFYYTLYASNSLIKNKGYSRHFGQLAMLNIPIPPYNEQKRIVEAIEILFKQLDIIKESL